jgi:histidyl-tRNA synthetase
MGIPVRGCRDVGPAAAAARRVLLSRFAVLAARYGFAEVETPVIERAALYAASLGATSDVVAAELFRVSGPGGDRDALTLRPEGTAGVARAFGQSRAAGEAARVWYAGPMFRYERPQRLRLRQFWQVGVECLGEEGAHADLDCISLAKVFLEGTEGGKGVRLFINCLGSKDDRKGYNAALREWLAPRYQSLSVLSRRRFDAGNCMRILDSKLAEDEDALRGAPLLVEAVSEAERARFARLQLLLDNEGMRYIVDPMLVRGLDYYSSTAFEFLDGEGRAVCAGGRYEGVEGADGVGFAAGLERIEGATEEGAQTGLGGVQGGVAVIAIVGPAGEGGETESVGGESVRRIRDAGMCALLWSARTGKIGKAIGRAVRDGALAIVLVGPDDVARNVVQVKLLEGTSHESRGDQQAVGLGDVVSVLVEHLGRCGRSEVAPKADGA